MQLIKELEHRDIGMENASYTAKYEVRKAARDIITIKKAKKLLGCGENKGKLQ